MRLVAMIGFAVLYGLAILPSSLNPSAKEAEQDRAAPHARIPPNEMRVEDVSSLDRQPGALLGRKTLVDCERECLGAKFARIPSCRISAAIASRSPAASLIHIQLFRYLGDRGG